MHNWRRKEKFTSTGWRRRMTKSSARYVGRTHKNKDGQKMGGNLVLRWIKVLTKGASVGRKRGNTDRNAGSQGGTNIQKRIHQKHQ